MDAVQEVLGNVPSLLSQAHTAYNSIPMELLLALHCFNVAVSFRQLKDRFLLSYWTSFMGCMGGGVVSSLLIMDRHAAPQGLFALDVIGKVWTAAWWAANYFPSDAVYSVYALPPFRMLGKCATITMRLGLIAARVDLAVKLFPGVVAAPLVLGTVAGSAGKFCVDAILTVSGDSKGPTEISMPGYVWRSGFFAAALYWGLVYASPILTADQGKALLVVVFLAHGLLQDVLGTPCDFTSPLSTVMHTLTNVPRPGVALLAAPVAVAKPAASSATSTGKAALTRKKQ